MEGMLEVCSAATFGAALQEVLHWAEQKKRLDSEDLTKLIHSPAYWVVVVVTIVATGIAGYFWYGGSTAQSLPRMQDALIFGAALPALFKKATAAASQRTLGGGNPPRGQSASASGSRSFTQQYLGL
jgi:hypothetical protein